MDLFNELKHIGLNRGEAAQYLYVLEHGQSTPPQIAKGTGITRTNTYHILRRLKDTDIIEEQRKGKRKSYIASDPSSLLRTLSKKKEVVERILPDLRGLYTIQKNKPQIRFYDGGEQVKEIFYDILETKEKKVIATGSTENLSSVLGDFFRHEWLPALQKRGIHFYDIFPFDSAKKNTSDIKNVLKGLHEFRVIPKKYGAMTTDVLIWDEYIALISFEEPIFGTIITNKNLAATFQLLYSVLWDSLPL